MKAFARVLLVIFKVSILNKVGTDVVFRSKAMHGGLNVYLVHPSKGIFFVKGILKGRPYYFKVIVIP